jgi:hypothetical protein
VTYLKGTLSAVAAIFVALLGAGEFLKYTSEQHAAEMNAVAGGLLATIFSPLFWILAISSFALLFHAGRLNSRGLRVFLFWSPTLIISTLGFGLFALFTYAWLHSKNG